MTQDIESFEIGTESEALAFARIEAQAKSHTIAVVWHPFSNGFGFCFSHMVDACFPGGEARIELDSAGRIVHRAFHIGGRVVMFTYCPGDEIHPSSVEVINEDEFNKPDSDGDSYLYEGLDWDGDTLLPVNENMIPSECLEVLTSFGLMPEPKR